LRTIEDQLDFTYLIVEDELLEDQNFITRSTKKYINQINNNYATMLLGADFTHSLKKLMIFLQKQFDLIIVQAPSVTKNKHTRALGTFMDGTILVIRQDYANKRKIRKAIRKLIDADVNLLGVVLNQS